MASRSWYKALYLPRFVETMTEGDHPAVRFVAAFAWNTVTLNCLLGPVMLARDLQERREVAARDKEALEGVEKLKARVELMKKHKAMWEYLRKRKAEMEGSE